MTQNLSKHIGWLRLAAGLTLVAWLLVVLFSPSHSVSADLPPRPEGTTKSASLDGAQIQLHVTDPAGGEWTAIEWQDPNTGKWHMVDGWRGDLSSDGIQIWWVGSNQFGDGPFRWLVYDKEGGDLVTVSTEFNLPYTDIEATIVSVTLEAEETE